MKIATGIKKLLLREHSGEKGRFSLRCAVPVACSQGNGEVHVSGGLHVFTAETRIRNLFPVLWNQKEHILSRCKDMM